MTSETLIALRISTALHVVGGGVLAGLAALTPYEPPHVHLHRGTMTVEVSFAAAESTSAAEPPTFLSSESVYQPSEVVRSELEAAVMTPLTKVSAEDKLVSADVPKLPLELEECQCEAPEHQI